LIEDNTLDAFISESVLATVDYILQKITTKETRIRLLSELLEYLRVLSCSTNICRRALQKNYPDLEDAILYQMVFEHAVDYFISNDRGLKKLSSPGLPVVSAKEFLSINK
jgi:predicted nucleic acid-binding protein